MALSMMCQGVRCVEVLFACGHTEMTYANNTDGLGHLLGMRENDERRTSNQECSNRGNIMTCEQKQRLNETQNFILDICEAEAKNALEAYSDVMERAHILTLQFSPTYMEESEDKLCISPELDKALQSCKSGELDDWAWQGLLNAFRGCRQKIDQLRYGPLVVDQAACCSQRRGQRASPDILLPEDSDMTYVDEMQTIEMIFATDIHAWSSDYLQKYEAFIVELALEAQNSRNSGHSEFNVIVEAQEAQRARRKMNIKLKSLVQTEKRDRMSRAMRAHRHDSRPVVWVETFPL